MRVCVVQIDPGHQAEQDRFTRLEAHVRQQAALGVELVVFPELFMSGYNIGAGLRRAAERPDGPFAQRVRRLAKELGIGVLYGYPEQAQDRLYNAAILIDAGGQVRAHHRKTVLPDGIEPDWFDAGADFGLARFGGATVGLAICYECEFPETIRQMVSHGAEAVFVITACGADWAQVPGFVVPARAYENGVFMVYANYCGTENGHGFCGRSCIVDPYGHDLARAGAAAEEAISATLDLALIAQARTRLPYLRDHLKLPRRLTRPKGLTP